MVTILKKCNHGFLYPDHKWELLAKISPTFKTTCSCMKFTSSNCHCHSILFIIKVYDDGDNVKIGTNNRIIT